MYGGCRAKQRGVGGWPPQQGPAHPRGRHIQGRNADIEDLFTIADYLALYNKAFNRRVKESDLAPGYRIVYRLQELHGKFDHHKPAEALLRDPKKLDALSDETLANCESLIERINDTID